MADDRMRNDDLDRNMGGANKDQDNYGQQTPGRNKQDDDLRTGQRAGQGHGQENEPGHMKDDFGNPGKKGQGQGQGQGGQNRGNI